mmetsp:Transcript_46056/g.127968  ORF Transcript_46056/g.127968 Transcript_46056/m.127968 type:complete len:294 (+) Transcript_46056:158-1039(+)
MTLMHAMAMARKRLAPERPLDHGRVHDPSETIRTECEVVFPGETHDAQVCWEVAFGAIRVHPVPCPTPIVACEQRARPQCMRHPKLIEELVGIDVYYVGHETHRVKLQHAGREALEAQKQAVLKLPEVGEERSHRAIDLHQVIQGAHGFRAALVVCVRAVDYVGDQAASARIEVPLQKHGAQFGMRAQPLPHGASHPPADFKHHKMFVGIGSQQLDDHLTAAAIETEVEGLVPPVRRPSVCLLEVRRRKDPRGSSRRKARRSLPIECKDYDHEVSDKVAIAHVGRSPRVMAKA